MWIKKRGVVSLKLSKRERSRMILEGIITAGILIGLYFAAYTIMRWSVNAFPDFFNSFWLFRNIIEQFTSDQSAILTPFVLLVLTTMLGLFIFWRLRRRYRQYELRHIISELHYIAQGNYAYRITGDYGEDIQRVVDSIHVLVDSTVEAMKEERKIEESKDELISNVSHDIRTPLTSVIGYLGLIEAKKYSTDEEAWRYAHTAYQKAKQMKVLVDDLFEYTQVRQPSTPLYIMTFDMVQLLEQLAADFEWEASKENMEIIVEPEKPSLEMEGDTEKLVRLFNNLLTNALKYSAGGKTIKIKTSQKEKRAILSISNEGETLPAEAMDQLFERFYRAEESRSQEVAGTGLGLAIARGITDLHHGTIEAEVKDGWTSFIITLPINQTESKAAEKPTKKKRKKLLLQ